MAFEFKTVKYNAAVYQQAAWTESEVNGLSVEDARRLLKVAYIRSDLLLARWCERRIRNGFIIGE